MSLQVPMTVIGGFLGAGKTTLLNHVLSGEASVRFAVLVNDFGDLAIDGDLVAAHGGDTVTFANGCVCCTLGDSLLETVDRLLAGAQVPQQFLVEASGVADPRSIADYATLHPDLARDLIVVLADVETARTKAADPRLRDTVERQLRAADLVVVNKCDLVGDLERAATDAWLRSHTPAALVHTVQARLPLELLRAHADEAPAQPASQLPRPGHEGHAPFETFRSVTVPMPDPVDIPRLKATLSALIPTVLRAKGFVRPADAPEGRCLVQLSGQRVEIHALERAGRAGPMPGLVFIGLSDLPGASELAGILGG